MEKMIWHTVLAAGRQVARRVVPALLAAATALLLDAGLLDQALGDALAQLLGQSALK